MKTSLLPGMLALMREQIGQQRAQAKTDAMINEEKEHRQITIACFAC